MQLKRKHKSAHRPKYVRKSVAHVEVSEVVRQVQTNEQITENVRLSTVSLLHLVSSVFSENVSGIRKSTVQHFILTGDHIRLRQLPRRVRVQYQPQLESMIKQMLEKTIIPSLCLTISCCKLFLIIITLVEIAFLWYFDHKSF